MEALSEQNTLPRTRCHWPQGFPLQQGRFTAAQFQSILQAHKLTKDGMDTIDIEVERRKAIDHEVNTDNQELDVSDEGTEQDFLEEMANGTHWLEGDEVFEAACDHDD